MDSDVNDTGRPRAPEETTAEPGDAGNGQTPPDRVEIPALKWYRIKEHGVLTGVCAGLAYYTSIPVEIIRLAFVVATLMGFGGGILIYIALVLIMPALPPGKKLEGGRNLVERWRDRHNHPLGPGE